MQTMVRLKFSGLGLCLPEAVAAVNGPVAPGPEWHHGVVATLGAYYGIHLSGLVGIHAAALFGPADRPATPATLGFVGKASGIEKFLFSSRKDELPPHTPRISKSYLIAPPADLLVLTSPFSFGPVG